MWKEGGEIVERHGPIERYRDGNVLDNPELLKRLPATYFVRLVGMLHQRSDWLTGTYATWLRPLYQCRGCRYLYLSQLHERDAKIMGILLVELFCATCQASDSLTLNHRLAGWVP